MMYRGMFDRYGARGPWREMERFQREMERLLSNMAEPRLHRPASYPAMNVWTNNEGVVVTAELPGVEPEDINISVVNDTLTVSGARRPDELKQGEKYHRRERNFGRFTRTFQLPFRVDADKVEAVFDKGVLQISLPRAEADKPRKIAIKAG